MGRRAFVISILFLAGFCALGQQPGSGGNDKGPNAVAPVLLPPVVTVSQPAKCEAVDGLVKLNALIDPSGAPHDVVVVSSDAETLNDFAQRWLAEQRFKPGTVDGVPDAIPVVLTVGLHTCLLPAKHKRESTPELTLSAHPFVSVSINPHPERAQHAGVGPVPDGKVAAIGGPVSAPLPTYMKEPEYPDEMKSRKPHGVCVLSVLVDAAGLPRNVQVVKKSEPAMDQSALEAVRSWRFQPALMHGVKPVPVVVSVAVAYRYYQKEYLAFATYLPLSPEVVAHLKRSELSQIITPPKLLNGDEIAARYMPRSRVPGDCLIAAVIGADGIPRDVQAVNSLDSSIDLSLVDAVQHMRFKAAMKDGTTPIPIGFVANFKYSQKDMLRPGKGPWWLDTLVQSAIWLWVL